MALSVRALGGRAAVFFLPFLAILAGRFATHTSLAAEHPRTAALLFLWLCADALALALIAKAPKNRPGIRALLGALAAGCIVATIGAAAPVREALFDMQAVAMAMGLTVLAWAGWSVSVLVRDVRRGRSLASAAEQVFPPQLVGFAAKELAMLRLALLRWGEAPDVPPGAQGFAYHRVINPMIATFLVLQLIEIVVVDLLVSHWSETAALVLLALGIWGALFIVALMKAFRLYPILLEAGHVRVRSGWLIDMRVPLDAIERIEPSISDPETKRPDVLNAAILSHPNIILKLKRPLEHSGFMGRTRLIERVAFRLDQPAPFIEALEQKF
ncbi:hypothetical protein K3163_12085 [Qipengyuania sp. 1NDW9]|uniref:hypothetical protein n=1 Tax=Qipengyuania xiapuensis TaxID=2867236 RepID=UPI001C868038|nr:hypothetical protein [Qipengyuania xiapuensis]MBX7493944.1 hypothetical protein [Qipengyuania xiapuensis]